jgi:hypothetical protein
MTTQPPFLLDSDVFIAAKNTYYAFDICPGFWKGILHTHERGRVQSIDRIRAELLSGSKEEDLVKWVQKGRAEGILPRFQLRQSEHGVR